MALGDDLSGFPERSVRIPVAGPPPFNTLVHLTFRVGFGEWILNSELNRRRVSYRSEFRIEGYDSRRPPTLHQSSSASIRVVGNTDDDQEFVFAVDAIELALDSDGHLKYQVDLAYKSGDNLAMTGDVVVSTYLLCYEPPLT